jgi:uncharacterized protein YggE
MTIQEKAWKTGMWVGTIFFIFLAVLTIKEIKSIGYVGKDTPIMNTISVSGKGEAVAVPDIATFSFTVTESATTVTEAQTKATTRTNNALKGVKDSGVADKDIKTTYYSINPKYEYQNAVCPTSAPSYVGAPERVIYCPQGKSTLTGYEVSQSIQVKIRDLDKAGAIFSTIGSLGVQNVNGLDFSIDDEEKVKSEARSLAIADAQSKAKELAKQLGVRLVHITSYYDNNDQPIYYGREGMGSDVMTLKATAAPTPQIPTGEQKVTSNVTITYEIR